MTQIRLGTPGDAARERELWQLAFGDDGAYVDNFYQTYYKPERMLLLEEDGVVRFPDAPTLRGVKHLEELSAARQAGYQAALCFIVQLAGAKYVQPNDVTHPQFGQALRQAAAAGVEVFALGCSVTPDSLTAADPVPVRL